MNTIILFIAIGVVIFIIFIILRFFSNKKKRIEVLPDVEVSLDPIIEDENKLVIEESNNQNEIDINTENSITPFEFSITTGESELYQKKLEDQRWIDIRNTVLLRDKYVCQHCHNCIDDIVLLNSISEILPYTEYSQSLYNFIHDIFHKKESLINEFSANEPIFVFQSDKILKTYNASLKVFIYTIIKEYDEFGMFESGNKRAHTEVISTEEISVDNLKWQHSDWLGNDYFYNKINQMKYQSVFINYHPDVHTNQNYYLKFNYGHAYAPFNGQWSLHKDGFVVSFDGYKKFEHENLGLNVHHKVYSNTGNPWDCELDDLVTLCKKCHIAEHERLENKIPIKSI